MSDDEKRQDQIRKETDEFMQKNRPVTRLNVTGKKAEEIKKIIAEKAESEGNEPNEDKLKAFAKKLLKIQDELMEAEVQADIEKREAEKEAKAYKEGGKGVVPL